jgi:hypothetical protein
MPCPSVEGCENLSPYTIGPASVPPPNLFPLFHLLHTLSKVSVLSSDICQPVLTDTGPTDQDICALFRDPDWPSLDNVFDFIEYLDQENENENSSASKFLYRHYQFS